MIDHLVYGTPDLAATVAELGSRLGIALTPGGRHVGLGTRNFLAGLGNGAYLEVIGPDVDRPPPEQPRPFGLDELTAPRLLTWAARASDLTGDVLSMSRRRENGVLLEWRVALPDENEDGLVPFLIDWGDSPHPSADAAGGLELISFTGTHPSPDRVATLLSALGQELPVTAGPPRLRAVVRGPAGEVVLT